MSAATRDCTGTNAYLPLTAGQSVRFMRRRQYAFVFAPMLVLIGAFFLVQKVCQ
jgi:hypothetical protein